MVLPNYDLRCNCGTIASRRQTQKKTSNYGRYFFTCANNNRCNFFKWADGVGGGVVNDERGMLQMQNANNASQQQQQQQFGMNSGAPAGPVGPPQTWLQTMQSTRVPDPFCVTHDIPCKEFLVRKQSDNYGRKFYSCPGEKNCFFMWASDWQSTYNNARPPSSVVVTHKGRQFTVSPMGGGGGSAKYDVQLELSASKTMREERVLVHLPNNDEVRSSIVSRISRIPGYNTEGHKGNTVSFPSTQMDTIISTVRAVGSHINVEPVPQKIREILHRANVFDEKDESHMDWSQLPDKLKSALHPFQRVGVLFGVKKNGVCLIADEMGLGKTIQSIAISYYYRDTWPLLVICPSSLRMNWSAEFEMWLMPHIRPCDINLIQKTSDLKADLSNFKITIISYELAVRNIEKLKNQKFKFIIADESHYLKAETSQRTKSIIPLMKAARRKIMITGTPALSRPKELFPQVDALLDSFINSFEYKRRYCNAVMGQFGLDDNGSSNLKELNYLLKKTVMIRREKKHVLTELPEKLRVQLTVEVSTQHRKNLDKLMNKVEKVEGKKNLARSFEELDQVNTRKNQDWMKMFGQTADAKIPAVTHFVQDRLKNTDDKFLIFAHHKVMMDAIEETAKKHLKKGNYIRIDGSTPNHQRQGLVDKFREEEKCRIAILSIQAAGTGLNFTPCNRVVFAELFWTPGALKQAEDRVHRLNQRSDVHITYIIGRHTIDEKIWPLILRKLEVLSKSLDMQEEDKEQWKKKKKWGKTSRVIEMLEQRNIEEKIQEEDEARQTAKEHEQLMEQKFQPKIQEVKERQKEREANQMNTLLDISSALDDFVYVEEGDILPPNQRNGIEMPASGPSQFAASRASADDDDMDLLNEDLTQSTSTTTSTSKKRKRGVLAPETLPKRSTSPATKRIKVDEKKDHSAMSSRLSDMPDDEVVLVRPNNKPMDKPKVSTTGKSSSKMSTTKSSSKTSKASTKKSSSKTSTKDAGNKTTTKPTTTIQSMFNRMSNKARAAAPEDAMVDIDISDDAHTAPGLSTPPPVSHDSPRHVTAPSPRPTRRATPKNDAPAPEIDPNIAALIDTLVYKPPERRTSTSRFFQSPVKKEPNGPPQPNRTTQNQAQRVQMEDNVLDFL